MLQGHHEHRAVQQEPDLLCRLDLFFFFSIDLERKQNLLHSVFFEQRARGAHPILGGDTRVSCSGGVSVQIAGGHFHSWV